jgi:hypothetical protein
MIKGICISTKWNKSNKFLNKISQTEKDYTVHNSNYTNYKMSDVNPWCYVSLALKMIRGFSFREGKVLLEFCNVLLIDLAVVYTVVSTSC